MHLASTAVRRWTAITLMSALACTLPVVARADRFPLVGTGSTLHGGTVIQSSEGLVVMVNPSSVPCPQLVDFTDIAGGATPGTNYDGVVVSGGLLFAERFVGQTVGFSAEFDVISGSPSNPLMPQVGAPGQNLDVFDYAGNVLDGLGNIGYPDIDAIGEGSISIYFPIPQSRVKLDLVGGNNGSATLSFYRADGSHIDDVLVSGLADLPYGFAMFDGSPSISGILIQNTDPSGIGIDNICFDAGATKTRVASWGGL